MCGRYSLFAPVPDLERRFDATAEVAFEPRYNAAPGQSLPVVLDADPSTIAAGTWGLVPPWGDGERLINARAETLASKPTFREAARERRCLVLADGFYEWRDGRPFRVTRDEPFAMAGVWSTRTPDDDQTALTSFGAGGPPRPDPPARTFAVVTTPPNDVVEPIHDRMAAVLPREREGDWLAAGNVPRLDVPEAAGFRAYPVSTALNDPGNDRPELIRPADDAA